MTALNTIAARVVEAMVEGMQAPLVALVPLPAIPDYCRKGRKGPGPCKASAGPTIRAAIGLGPTLTQIPISLH